MTNVVENSKAQAQQPPSDRNNTITAEAIEIGVGAAAPVPYDFAR